MESKNLQTASSYINNLLLSRGLLRNGVPIDFAEPAKTVGGTDATMANIMNLVHDLILRRDREADTLSTISQNLQIVRTSSVQQTETIARLENHNAELDRQLALSSAQEKMVRATLRSAETRTRALREEMVRLKATVAQIRGQCANDIRRRDGEISRLKRHLEGRRGREGNGGQVGVVVITPSAPRTQHNSSGAPEGCLDVASSDYSLKQETTEFLTQLSQSLSDENDALIGLVRNTLATLRSLQGLPVDYISAFNGNLDHIPRNSATMAIAAPPTYEELASDTDDVLEHLRGLLTNPSFVPLEEVEIREDEIIRLREGWEKMATRWKEAVALMDGWRKRMVDSGDTINLEDLTKGMDLAVELPTVSEAEQNLIDDDQGENDLSSSNERTQEAALESPEAQSPDKEGEMDDLVTANAPFSSVLKDRSANARPILSPHKVSFPDIPEESETTENLVEITNTLLDFSTVKPQPSPIRRRSRPFMEAPSSPRTVQQKLDAAEAEATNARTVEEKKGRKNAAKAVNNRLGGSRRRSTLSPEELMNLMGSL
ncbi:MAG: hypothetical protein Q9195_007555 [Heterodermia aff. obscurata]